MGAAWETVEDHFRGTFEGTYDGSYGTRTADYARASFGRLTDCRIMWAQIHGDFKDAAKRALFVQYPHWPELYECCRDVIRAHAPLNTQYIDGGHTCARIMREAMVVLRARYGVNAPRWWLPLLDAVRGKNHNVEKYRKQG